jgi:ferric-dicitrate binding protein FerR (iron transport regulator)
MDTKKEILKRFTNNKFSFNDYLLTSSFFKEERYLADLQSCMETDWNETENAGNKNERLDQLLDSLHHQINLKHQFIPVSYSKFYRVVSKIAVVLLIPALITIVVLSYFSLPVQGVFESYAEIYAPVGTRARFRLPDGTEGWLNSGSSIKYPVSFKKRQVELSGEAWFDVVHRPLNDFQVITPYFNIKVLGTRFNVAAYQREETAEVILEQGKVAIFDTNNEMKAELLPDQQLIYNKSTKYLRKANIDSKVYTSWKDGLLIFKNEPMTEIARRLERKYNAEIILHGDSLKASLFRATFQDESLDEICKMLSEVASIQYRIYRREKQADNTFTKSKIEMWFE